MEEISDLVFIMFQEDKAQSWFIFPSFMRTTSSIDIHDIL